MAKFRKVRESKSKGGSPPISRFIPNFGYEQDQVKITMNLELQELEESKFLMSSLQHNLHEPKYLQHTRQLLFL